MASFLDKTDFDNEQKEIAAKIIQDWGNACKDFANGNEKTWKNTRHDEIVEDVNEYLGKAKAMAEMLIHADFNILPPGTLYDYFWELSSLLTAAKSVFEDLQ